MIFRIAVCTPDGLLFSRIRRHCMEYFARRTDECAVEQVEGAEALVRQYEEGARYELYLIELIEVSGSPVPAGLKAASILRRRGCRAPLAFLAKTPAYAYNAFRVDAMQYLLIPFRSERLAALLDRAVEPEYGPVVSVTTAEGICVLPYSDIEYLECTHHIVHFHRKNGSTVTSLSLRVPFSEVARPLLADGRFYQHHRSYVINMEAVERLAEGEFRMQSGALVPVPRCREAETRTAFRAWLEQQTARKLP